MQSLATCSCPFVELLVYGGVGRVLEYLPCQGALLEIAYAYVIGKTDYGIPLVVSEHSITKESLQGFLLCFYEFDDVSVGFLLCDGHAHANS